MVCVRVRWVGVRRGGRSCLEPSSLRSAFSSPRVSMLVVSMLGGREACCFEVAAAPTQTLRSTPSLARAGAKLDRGAGAENASEPARMHATVSAARADIIEETEREWNGAGRTHVRAHPVGCLAAEQQSSVALAASPPEFSLDGESRKSLCRFLFGFEPSAGRNG